MRARIRVSNKQAVANRWPSATFHPHDPQWHDGCADPGCCQQHPGFTPDGEAMVSVEIKEISGREFHRGLLELANENLVVLESTTNTTKWE